MKKNRLIILAWFAAAAAYADTLPEVLMHKDPNCGCCSAWAEHLAANGFMVKTVATDDMQSVKRRFAVPQRLTSCHTARVGNYVIEGHVPAAAIKRLLREKPAVSGLSVPGMPIGSPGMEQGDRHDAYAVLAFDAKGRTRMFEQH